MSVLPKTRQAATSLTPTQQHQRNAHSFRLSVKHSTWLRYCLAGLVGAMLTMLYAAHSMSGVSASVKANHTYEVTQNAKLNSRIDTFASSCEGKGTCKTFPFTRAGQVALLYALTCFNYSAQSPPDDQTNRLKSAPGAASTCGWNGDGSATTVAVIPNSSYNLNTLDSAGNPDPSIGLVGSSVVLAGQTEVLNFVAPVKSGAGGLVVASPGALYPTVPSTFYASCTSDSSSTDGEAIRLRLQQLEKGRVNTPNIDPRDYVVSGLNVGKFGRSIRDITVTDVTVCQNTATASKDVRTVIAREHFSGPTPGSHFDFTYGYGLTLREGKWFVNSWGPAQEIDGQPLGG